MKKHIFIIVLLLIIISCSSQDENIIKASGTIEATEVIISSKNSGFLSEQYFQEGNSVSKDQLLAEIDIKDLEIQKKQAEGSLEFYKAQYEMQLNGARSEDIRMAEEQLQQAKTNLKSADTDKIRTENLYPGGSVSKQTYDDAHNRYDIALSQYNSALSNMNKIKSGSRSEEKAAQLAMIKQSEANLDNINKKINDAKIFSPIDGIIVKKLAEKGELVNFGTRIAKLSDLKLVKIKIYIDEKKIGLIKLGNEVDVMIDTFNDRIFKGIVSYISPEAEFTPKNVQSEDERVKLVFAVKIEINNEDMILKPGLPADAYIHINKSYSK